MIQDHGYDERGKLLPQRHELLFHMILCMNTVKTEYHIPRHLLKTTFKLLVPPGGTNLVTYRTMKEHITIVVNLIQDVCVCVCVCERERERERERVRVIVCIYLCMYVVCIDVCTYMINAPRVIHSYTDFLSY